MSDEENTLIPTNGRSDESIGNDSNSKCAVCCAKHSMIEIPGCGHRFHSRCIFSWPIEQCPVCKTNASKIIVIVQEDNDEVKEPRSGKWSKEEEDYTDAHVREFMDDFLPCSSGTSLLLVISTILNCRPMRLSKKYQKKPLGRHIVRKVRIGAKNCSYSVHVKRQRQIAKSEALFHWNVSHSRRKEANFEYRQLFRANFSFWTVQLLKLSHEIGQKFELRRIGGVNTKVEEYMHAYNKRSESLQIKMQKSLLDQTNHIMENNIYNYKDFVENSLPFNIPTNPHLHHQPRPLRTTHLLSSSQNLHSSSSQDLHHSSSSQNLHLCTSTQNLHHSSSSQNLHHSSSTHNLHHPSSTQNLHLSTATQNLHHSTSTQNLLHTSTHNQDCTTKLFRDQPNAKRQCTSLPDFKENPPLTADLDTLLGDVRHNQIPNHIERAVVMEPIFSTDFVSSLFGDCGKMIESLLQGKMVDSNRS